MTLRFRKTLMAFLLATLLLVTACQSQPPSRWDKTQQETKGRQTAVVKESKSGGSFNKFFPPSGDGYDRVYTQEKKGFAEAKLKKDGQEVAMMSISDVLNNPSAAEKFKQSTKTLAGYPAVQQGTTATSILVNNRFQVKVLSRSPAFSASDREDWLEKFDLQGLAKLK